DGDGVLSRAEAAAAPPPASLASPLGLLGFVRRAGVSPQRLSPGRDGKVTREGLAAYYRPSGLAPFPISEQPAQLQPAALLQGGTDATADQLTDRLFRLLDTDQDGKLSRKELEAAPEVLARLDFDEDEMLTPEELMGEAGGAESYARAVLGARGLMRGVSSRP